MSFDNLWNRKKVLITGGLGFIGSNLAIQLVQLGADVTILDALWKDHGGNLFNIEPIKNSVHVNISDIRDKRAVEKMVQDKDFIFHLAGQCSHVLGQSDPFPDIDINIHGTAVILEAMKSHAPRAILVYTSTRGVYGSPPKLPADESSPLNPKGLYELSNLTAEKIIAFYGSQHRLRAVNLRLSNIYGERAQMKHSNFGVVNWFIRLMLDEKPIKLFGDGKILRDFLYIDDCVAALLAAATAPAAYGDTFNVGHNQPSSFLQLTEMMLKILDKGTYDLVPFTKERASQEPGDFFPDLSKIQRTIGWTPRISLETGLTKAFNYYTFHKEHYW